MLDTNDLSNIAKNNLPNDPDARIPHLIKILFAAEEIDANRARIAELESLKDENARLRRVIGEIPEGKECMIGDMDIGRNTAIIITSAIVHYSERQ